MTMIEPTMEEMERLEENQLLETIDTMNKNYQLICNQGKNKENLNPNGRDAKELSKRYPSLNKNSALVNKFNFLQNSPDSELNFLPVNISPIISKMSTGPNTLSLENSDISNMEAFLNQNLIK